MSIKQKIQGIIKTGLDKLEIDFELDKIIIETPKDNKLGDYSTNIALMLTKILKDNPMNIASKIVSEIKDEIIEKVEIATPGFINIYLTKKERPYPSFDYLKFFVTLILIFSPLYR